MSNLQDRTPSAKWQGLALWLLLLSIFTHATLPAGSPLQPVQGSAFIAYTSDVSLAPAETSLSERHASPNGRDDPSASGPDQSGSLVVAAAALASPFPHPEQGVAASREAVRPAHAASSPFAPRAPPTV